MSYLDWLYPGFYFSPEKGGAGTKKKKDPPDDTEKKPGEKDGDEKTVPYERFREINEAKKKSDVETAKIKKELDALKKTVEDKDNKELSEVERLTKAQEELQTSFDNEQLKNRKLEVAGKLGVPAGMVDRLKGSTIEELTEDGEALMEFVKTEEKGKSPPKPGGKEAGEEGFELEGKSPAEVRKARADGKTLT